MKPRTLVLLSTLLCLPAHAITYYPYDEDFASWSAAVGPYLVEDFESYEELRLPVEGGFTELDHFSIYNDDQGANDWTGDSGIYSGINWYAYPEIPNTKSLIISTEGNGSEPEDGPTVIDAVFPYPIQAIGFEYAWCEDDNEHSCTFQGLVFDTPATTVSLWKAGQFSHSWGAIDAVYWVPVPEPASATLLLLGLIAFGVRARRTWADHIAGGERPSVL